MNSNLIRYKTEIEYDPEVHALSINCADRVVGDYSRSVVDGDYIFDVDKDGNLLAIEILLPKSVKYEANSIRED